MLGGLPRDEAGQPVVFDGAGNRISQSLNDCLTTRFVYDGPNVVMEMSAGGGSAYGGNVSNQVIWAWVNAPGLDQPVERIAFINGEARNRQVFHADGLGSIAALTDESGEPVQTYTYAAFGSIRTQTGTDLNRITYTAREAMGDSLGFFYYRHRIYDPHTGRFTSEDPLGFVDGANVFIYVGNNPAYSIDPFGLSGNPISGGGTDIYYPHGGWGAVNAPSATFEHRTTSGFANAYRMSEPVLVCFGVVVGGAVAVYYGIPYVIAGGAAIFTTGQNIFYRLMSSQPMSVLDRMILYCPQSPPARATVAELCNSSIPYASQISYGIAPGPGGPFANRGEALLWMTGRGIGQAYETLQSDSLPDK